ncbi:hypothetical protein N7510_000906 [Penicillium lagena]|uniref:uncharacterized protein n=1 Tax=Penicillium lagena TaxID=94218 RepID=UPI0025420122|nr:uncharacterized protein N7510_000906 [Penicillium lagena]KAJ5624597.1 hypothetical protein N7510_000906 [Penicillium lagena]
MLRDRHSTRKPDDELISRFQRTFADVVTRRGSNGHETVPLNKRVGDPMKPARTVEDREWKFLNQRTPRNLPQPSWRFTHTDAGLDKFMPIFPPIPLADVQPNAQGIMGQHSQHFLAQQMPGMKMDVQAQPQSFAPSAFMHRGDSGYDAMDESSSESEMQMVSASNTTTSSGRTS